MATRGKNEDGEPTYSGGRVLSKKPENIRRRIRGRDKVVAQDIEMLYGKPVEEWDLEELARGRPRHPSGGFRGPRPKWITSTVLAEAQRRLKERAFEDLSANVDDAVKVLAELMQNNDTNDFGDFMVPAKVKLDAATFIVEQVVGKAKSQVEIGANDSLKSILATVMVNPDGLPSHQVIEGAIVKEGDEDAE